VLSDVYVQVTNNVDYIEHALDKPETHLEVMARIVRHGNRVRSCGMNFVRNYYPQKGVRHCPFAWRNPQNPKEILTEEKGDKDFDYLNDYWFKSVIEGDTSEWSSPFYDGYDNQTRLVAYMVPIHNAEGKPVAVLGADVSLDWLTEKLEEADSTYNAQTPYAIRMLGLKSQTFILNYDGSFLTHPKAEKRMEGNFFNYVLGPVKGMQTPLERNIKKGLQSSKETKERYLFNGEASYFFYTPLKYTGWVMVTVVPCRQLDALAVAYVLRLIGIFLIGLVLIVVVAFIYLHQENKKNNETDQLECERPQGM
jgi:hypothetical protein